MKGGQGGTKYRGPSRGPALIKFFFRNTREEMLDKLRLRYVRTYVQCTKSGEMGKNMSPPVKIVVPQQKKKTCPGEGMLKRPPSGKYRKKLNVFYTCCLWVRTAAILSSVSSNHYGFLRILIKNNLFSALITEQNSLFFISITTRQQFFISVSESTKTYVKAAVPQLFSYHI